VPGGDRALVVGRAIRDLGGSAVRGDAQRLVAGGEDRARLARRVGEGVGERPHAADRYVPVSGAAADHVVEEAAVLLQGGVVGVGEGADEGVGEDHTAHQVVLEVLLHGGPDRLLEQHPPGLLVVEAAAQLVAGGQRLREGREDPLGGAAGPAVELPPGPVLAVGTGEPGERLPGAPFAAADEESGGPAVAFCGCVGGDGTGADPEVQRKVPDDLLRQQADQVRVAGQPGVDPGEGAGGHRRAARVVQPLQDQHGAPGPGQIGGGDQAVVAAADDDGVVGPVCAGSLGCGHGSW
jgi:hypothetical protein